MVMKGDRIIMHSKIILLEAKIGVQVACNQDRGCFNNYQLSI
jgi:hypothetical protein